MKFMLFALCMLGSTLASAGEKSCPPQGCADWGSSSKTVLPADVHQCEGGITIVDADRTTAEVCADVADRQAQFDELEATGGINHTCVINGETYMIRSKSDRKTTCDLATARQNEADMIFGTEHRTSH